MATLRSEYLREVQMLMTGAGKPKLAATAIVDVPVQAPSPPVAKTNESLTVASSVQQLQQQIQHSATLPPPPILKAMPPIDNRPRPQPMHSNVSEVVKPVQQMANKPMPALMGKNGLLGFGANLILCAQWVYKRTALCDLVHLCRRRPQLTLSTVQLRLVRSCSRRQQRRCVRLLNHHR
jgi:hypothetical protein